MARRSKEFGKTREPENDSLGSRFATLVRKYMTRHGYKNQYVAYLVYRDEERISSVSDVLNARSPRPSADTIKNYQVALEIPQDEIDRLFESNNSGEIAAIASDIAVLAEARKADMRTIGALTDALDELRQARLSDRLSNRGLHAILAQFLDDVGAGNTDPILWPAILRNIAEEIIGLRRSLTRPANVSVEIDRARSAAAVAIDRGDYADARQSLQFILETTGAAYRDQSDSFSMAATDHARALASLASLAFAELDYASAKEYYSAAFKVNGISDERRDRYRFRALVAFNILIAKCNTLSVALAYLDEMKEAGVAPNEVTYNTLINLSHSYDEGRAILGDMERAGLVPNDVTYNTLINLSGSYEEGEKLLDLMRMLDVPRDSFTYNTLIKLSGSCEEGCKLLDRMKRDGVAPDTVTYNTLINMSHSYDEGLKLIGDMEKSDIPRNEVTYTTLIRLSGSYGEGRKLLDRMTDAGIATNDIAYSLLVSLSEDYQTASRAIDEIKALRQTNPSEAQLTAALSKLASFEQSLEVVLEFRARGYFTGRALYEALFAKPIVSYSARDLLAIYDSLPFRFASSLQSPINQFRRMARLDDAVVIALRAPFTDAARRLFREEAEACAALLDDARQAQEDPFRLSYACGVAAAEWGQIDRARAELEAADSLAPDDAIRTYIRREIEKLPAADG